MKVLHVCHSDGFGGAAIGAKRLHQTMLSQGVASNLLVAKKFSNDPTVIELPDDLARTIKERINNKLLSLHSTDNPIIRSLNIFGRGAAEYINSTDADVVQFHWVNADMISIRDVSRIAKPLVWKLPDMWAFSGAEHYLLPDDPLRYKFGYSSNNRPVHEKGIDLNKHLWRYKRYCWKNARFSVVCPSKWLAMCANESELFSQRDIFNIANPLNLAQYSPGMKLECRRQFDLPEGRVLVLFAALASLVDKRKGFHYFNDALEKLSCIDSEKKFEVVILGNDGAHIDNLHGYKVHNLGRFKDQGDMINAYRAADFHVFPTQADNLPNVVKEAAACGLPCVGFNVGGMPDMVEHLNNGYLAEPFNIYDLVAGLQWMLRQDLASISANVRAHAVDTHDPNKCVKLYMEVYEKTIREFQHNK